LLMFRRRGAALEVLLVHPGGPFYRNKDLGVWSVPKGVASENEDLLARAIIEFEEELGLAATTAAGREPVVWFDLGTIKQKGGKTVRAWAFEGNLPENFVATSNIFELEWPPRSGQMQKFPEIDRAEFFSLEEAKAKINEAQIPLLDRLVEAVSNA
jgi:predicted NUDIX family NTP pyrophosphohydrolase